MAKPKKQRRRRGDTWSTRVSKATHKRVALWAKRNHYIIRAAYDVLLQDRLDELEGKKPDQNPMLIPVHGPADMTKITMPRSAKQQVFPNG